jgi:small multidrug resistance family-3 protein
MTFVLKTPGLFVLTALAEILSCYLPYLWLKEKKPAWLLTLHPGSAARVYAAYGGVYVSVALLWLWLVEGQPPGRWDVLGVAVTLAGMAIIAFAPRAR